MNSFGFNLRRLRESAGLSLQQVASGIEMDVSLLAKIERNERWPSEEKLDRIADFFSMDKDKLRLDLLSDKIVYEIKNETEGLNILKVAEQKVLYRLNLEENEK